MMTLSIYLNFNGTCAEAFRYYERHLGGVLGMMMARDEAPDGRPSSDGWENAMRHAEIVVGSTTLMGADVRGAEPMRSAYLTLFVDSDADAERTYTALSDGGQVLMKMEETFYATRFGQVRDRFGINWSILHQRPTPPGV